MMDRNTPFRDGELFAVPVAKGTEIFGGLMVMVNAQGFAVPAAPVPAPAQGQPAAATGIVLGVSDGWVDNTAGNDGDVSVIVRRRKAWLFATGGADAVTQADTGRDCFVADSLTVARTSGNNTRPKAGTVQATGPDGVWVLI